MAKLTTDRNAFHSQFEKKSELLPDHTERSRGAGAIEVSR